MLLRKKPEVTEQVEKGEQPLQSFVFSVPDACSVSSSLPQSSKIEQGTTTLKKMYKANMPAKPFFTWCKGKSKK